MKGKKARIRELEAELASRKVRVAIVDPSGGVIRLFDTDAPRHTQSGFTFDTFHPGTHSAIVTLS